jgi:Zn-finger nucleic acid-binding protein
VYGNASLHATRIKTIRCPRCRALMQRGVREGIEIDGCRECAGAWFDPGEIDRILHRVTAQDPLDLPAAWEPGDELVAALSGSGR